MDFQNKFDRLLADSQELKSDIHLDIRDDPKYKTLFANSTNYLALALSTPGFEKKISHYLSEKYNHNSNLYDIAIDTNYNQTHIGGSTLHHNLDGCHTWVGAIKTLQEQFPNDSDLQIAYRALIHLAKDSTTPSGINPFLTPAEFLQSKQFLTENLYIPRSVANDLLNINVAELCGATVAMVALLLDLDKMEEEKLGQYAGRLSLSSFFAGNPALLLITVVCLGQICYRLWRGDSIAKVLNGTIQGGLSAGTFFYVAVYFPGPIFLGLATATVACLGLNWFYKQTVSNLRSNLDEILEMQFSEYRSYYKLIS